jgi:hypothetical protein
VFIFFILKKRLSLTGLTNRGREGEKFHIHIHSSAAFSGERSESQRTEIVETQQGRRERERAPNNKMESTHNTSNSTLTL